MQSFNCREKKWEYVEPTPLTDEEIAELQEQADRDAARGMEYEYGKYYLDGEDGNTYLCQRTGEAAGGTIVLQYMPHELVGNYFTAVNM